MQHGGADDRDGIEMTKTGGNSALNQNMVLESLHTINSQLGELLSRVGQPPPPPPPPPPTQLGVPMPGGARPHNHTHTSFLDEPPPLNASSSAGRWADPVVAGSHVVDLELENKRHSYSNIGMI